MTQESVAKTLKQRLHRVAQSMGTESPLPYVGDLIERSFWLPQGDMHYAQNTLTPGTVPFEPSFSEQEPNTLRFTIEPLGPDAPPVIRRDEATREMRRLVSHLFGGNALRWFDERSEEWRGLFPNPHLSYGAWFGNAYDRDGLHSSKIYYELRPNELSALPLPLATLARIALESMPALVPVFTTITCQRDNGKQRITFLHWNGLRLTDLNALLSRLGLSHRLSAVMQVFGLALGGRFDLPERSLFVGLSGTPQEPELKLEVALGMLPDLPPSFLRLLTLGLSERPRELQAMQRWLQAFTPESYGWPGHFSILSVCLTPNYPARVSLYLRPIEFDLSQQQLDGFANGYQRTGIQNGGAILNGTGIA
ncbi:hypothetical protein H6F89_14200 [Cyanobacteria bacterium FACHB-63]|nr:hypothetical protein [Cyanobacteria bacterium FACHB-63]